MAGSTAARLIIHIQMILESEQGVNWLVGTRNRGCRRLHICQ